MSELTPEPDSTGGESQKKKITIYTPNLYFTIYFFQNGRR
jgi:hypothetical protein